MGDPIYSLKNLRTIQVELTANCNAMCPACDRWVRSIHTKDKTLKIGDLNPTIAPYQGSKGHITLQAWKNLFTPESLANLRMVTYNGTWGDAILHPEIFSYTQHIIDTIKETDNKLVAHEISTNAGLHPTDWWRKLANLNKQFYQPNSKVIFCIDGLDDKTHQMYRRAVKWERVMENAKAYIDEGGRAVWQWLQFDHNKHQVEEAKELAKELGFAEFWHRGNRGERLAVQKTVRSLGTDKFEDTNEVSLFNSKAVNRRVKHNKAKEGSVSYIVDDDKTSVNTKEITSKYKNYEDYRENTKISCSWGNDGKINVEFNGLVHPCCFVNHYMNNFWSDELEKDSHLEGNEYEIMTDGYAGNWNNLNHNNLQDILSHNFYANDLEESWNRKTSDLNLPRLGVCISHCGEGHKNIRSYDVNKL